VTERGLTVLALHGQPGTGDDFALVARALDAQPGTGDDIALEGRCRLLAPDRRGWGSRAEEPAAGFAAGADDAVAVLDRAGVHRAVVLGFSWGGGVALELARRHPERVGALVLAASIGPAEPTRADRMLALPVAGRLMCAGGLAATRLALRRPAFHGIVAGGMRGMHPDHVRTFADRSLTPAVLNSFMVEQRALVQEFPTVLRDLAALRVPTTVVQGDRDRMIAPGSARRLAEGIPGAALLIIPGAGHFLPGAAAPTLADAVLTTAARAAW
jgi:pimeloyl-ACP methyl ester carboxylesterase